MLLGATRQEVDEAERTGTLLALAAERFLLPGDRQHDAEELAALSGADAEVLVKLFLALGFPQPTAVAVFTDYDVEAVKTFLRNGTADLTEYSLHEARVISAALGRIAEVFVDEVWDEHLAPGRTERQALMELAPTLDFDRVERMLLSSEDPNVAAMIGLRLATLARPELPPVRVGIALGPVLVRQGDCFGPTVNLVSRVVDRAPAGGVVVNRAMADALAGLDTWTIASLGSRPLKSFGDVELWALAEAPPNTPTVGSGGRGVVDDEAVT